MIKVSIVIAVCPFHNQNKYLGLCLQHIIYQTFPKDCLEIILIGDGCKIKKELLPSNIAISIHNFKEPVGVVDTRNKGLALAKGEYIAFLDADCFAEKTWLAKLSNGLAKENIIACNGKVIERFKGKVFDTTYLCPQSVLPNICLCNVIIKRQVINEIGGFTKYFTYGAEEPDFFLRLYLKGYQALYIPDAVVEHKTHKSIKKYIWYGVSKRQIINKYKNIFNISAFSEFVQIHKFHNERKLFYNRFSLLERIKPYFSIYGYFTHFLKELFRIEPKITPLVLSEKTLQPSNSIKPLKAKINNIFLFKPNNIIYGITETESKIVDVYSKKHFILNKISDKIWKALHDGLTKSEITNKLLQEYHIEKEQLGKDISIFINTLLEEGLLNYYDNTQNKKKIST
ncbi:PqqD family peptide modification chaperone [Candidatus Margulisiibacteriota bacterium]